MSGRLGVVRWIAPVLALLLIATASGCGRGKPKASPGAEPVSPAAIRAKNRLKTRGYDVTIQRRIRSSQSYEAHVTVPAVDFTSPRAFNVDIFFFGSRSKAEAYRRHLTSGAGTFGRLNRYAVVGADLFVGSHYGQPVGCKVVNGAVRCPPQPTVPLTDFNKVISVVTG